MFIFGPIQRYEPGIPIVYPLVIGRAPKSIAAFLNEAVQKSQFEADALYRDKLRGTAVTYISLLSVLCPGGRESCRLFDRDGWPMFIDATHISVPAATDVVGAIADQIEFPKKSTASPVVCAMQDCRLE